MSISEKIKVLFLCTHNSARSQMAEGLLRYIGQNRFEVYSAGTQVTFVRPLAIQAMREIGIDISGHTSKELSSFIQQRFDYVITVCDQANESCPYFPNARQRLHWSFPDPSQLRAGESEEAQLNKYCLVRNQIQEQLNDWLASLSTVEFAKESDLIIIENLLKQADLPVDDVAKRLSTTFVVRQNNNVIGTAALELYGQSALLRSVVISQDSRAKGIGKILVEAMLDLAFKHSVSKVYLLTNSAAKFFKRLGFEVIERGKVDVAVQASAQFTSLCSEDSLVMVFYY